MKNKITLLDFLIKNYNYDEKKATGLILSGDVLIDEVVTTKPKTILNKNSTVRIKPQSEFVSRGAYKLLTAIKNFSLDIRDRVCMDVGSSTGGFTEVLLLNGAKKVYAIDCGTNQLDYKLRSDKRVVVYENTKITNFNRSNLVVGDKIELVVIDVSFTSSIYIVDYIFKEFVPDTIVVLIKPQFEYERLIDILNLSPNFNGVVKESDVVIITDYIERELNRLSIEVKNRVKSDILGTKGNIEYLFELVKRSN